MCVHVCWGLPALVPVRSKENQDLSALLVWILQHTRKPIHQRPLDARIIHLTHTHRVRNTHTHSRRHQLLIQTLKLWNMSRFCCLNWKYWARSLKVSTWLNFRALRKRRMKSSSVLRKPISGLVTIMSRISGEPDGDRTSLITTFCKPVGSSDVMDPPPGAAEHLLDVLVESFWVLVQLHSSFLRGLGAQAGVQVRHHGVQPPETSSPGTSDFLFLQPRRPIGRCSRSLQSSLINSLSNGSNSLVYIVVG